MRLGVYIGRFQPFHLGHLHVVRQALMHVDRLLILIGSSGEPRTSDNPWNERERSNMILHGMPGDIPDVVDMLPIYDHGDDFIWAEGVRAAVGRHLGDLGQSEAQIYLAGHAKDETSFYLRMFPEWRKIVVQNHRKLSATPMREAFFLRFQQLPTADVGEAVSDWAEAWLVGNPEAHGVVSEEYLSTRIYKGAWANSPHPPIFTTTDSLVVSGDEIALIRRGRSPGCGRLALPGGFLEPHLRLLDNALKEFGEEAGDLISPAYLRRHLTQVQVFDKPGRDPRGRFITHVHRFDLPVGVKPRLVAGDDAEWAGWVHIDDIDRSQMFADHFKIIQLMMPKTDIQLPQAA
jgi:bifunctional NMN adenylyltransferase/nudix hydrolase